MGAAGTDLVASTTPIGATTALVVLLVVAALGLYVARRAAASREPMFPELATPGPDPATFARELAAGGNVADDAARFTDVAHRSGVQQAYALLALVNTDGTGSPGTAADPFAALADLAPLEPPAVAPAATAPGEASLAVAAVTSQGPPAHTGGDGIAPAELDPLEPAVRASVHPDDTLLPGRRPADRHGHAA
jgi:hypothetical protein